MSEISSFVQSVSV